jgi:hypothetical protein
MIIEHNGDVSLEKKKLQIMTHCIATNRYPVFLRRSVGSLKEYSTTILEVTRGNKVQCPRPCTRDLGSLT